MKLLLVSVGRGRYAVAADDVARILDSATEPDLQLERRGREVTYRGSSVTIVDLDRGPEAPDANSRRIYLVLEARGKRGLLPVDGADAIREVPPAVIAPLPPFIFAGQERRFRGIFSDGGEPRLVLDVEGIL